MQSRRIHIYLHLVECCGECIGTVSIPYMDPMGIYDSSSGKAHRDELFSP